MGCKTESNIESIRSVSGSPTSSSTTTRLRACFAELKAEVLLYALGHEKDLRHRPFGRRVGLSTRPPTRTAHALRDIFNAIFYVLRSGCSRRMLPGDFPPWSTVYYNFRGFRLSELWNRAMRALIPRLWRAFWRRG